MPKGILALLAEGPSEEGGAEERALEDFWEAQKTGNSKTGLEAFRRLYKLCGKKPAEKTEDAPEDSDDDGADEDDLLAG